MNRKNNISVTTMVPTRRTYSTLIPKGRDGGFPRNVHDNYYDMLELEASLILDKMKNMTPEEAAAAAAEAVAEAEVAIAQAEEAMLEAEAAEAEARAAVAALCTLKGRKTRDMKPWSKISGVRVGRVEPRSD